MHWPHNVHLIGIRIEIGIKSFYIIFISTVILWNAKFIFRFAMCCEFSVTNLTSSGSLFLYSVQLCPCPCPKIFANRTIFVLLDKKKQPKQNCKQKIKQSKLPKPKLNQQKCFARKLFCQPKRNMKNLIDKCTNFHQFSSITKNNKWTQKSNWFG